MNQIKLLFILLITLSVCFSADINTDSNQKVEVVKEYTELNGLYTFVVKYRKGNAGLVTQVSIWDSLPENLELVDGVLVKKIPNVIFFSKRYINNNLTIKIKVGENWESNIYTARVTNFQFTLDNRTLEIRVPPAEISFNAGSGKLDTVVSNTFDISVRGPKIPTGNL